MSQRTTLVIVASAVLAGAACSAQAAVPTSEPSGSQACALALAEVARTAALRGWQADARCVSRAPAHEVQSVEPLAADADLRSGLLAMNLRSSRPAQVASRMTVRVTWIAPAWVATRNLSQGVELQAQDLAVSLRRWADGQAIDAADAGRPLEGRVLRALRAGDPLLPTAWSPAGSVLRGDRVQAVMSGAGLEVRLAAWVVAPARVGERVRVQPSGGADVLVGVLQNDQTVRVEGLRKALRCSPSCSVPR